MATRCTIGEHGSCSACERFVAPTEADHAHIYRGRTHERDLICQNCWLSTILAATATLTALRNAGVLTTDWTIVKRLIETRVVIGVQAPLDLGASGLN